jgi:molecular chaperone DnaK
MSKIIGIDLGSTLSEVAIMEGGQPTILVNEEGSRTTPSVISFSNDGERKVGASAKRQAITNPKGTVNLIKRFMGGTYDEVKDNITHVQYDVVDKDGYPRVNVNDREYTPEELSAMILTKMKKIAEDYLQEEVTEAVITVPAYFNDAQRDATKKAGEIAGLNVRRIVAEPTAAILASNIDMEKGGKYMVVDYGGSTLDFSIADIADGVVEILASNGDVYCGGSDLDKKVSEYIVKEFKKAENVDLSNDTAAMSRVMEAAEKAKMELSTAATTEINLPYITAVDGMPKHLMVTLSKAKFEQLIDSEIAKIIRLGKESIKKANITVNDIDGILLVGGSTRIPKVQDELTKAFNRPLIKNVNVDEVVALGAAVQASILAGDRNDILLLDVTPLSLGIDTMGGVMATIVEANTTIPCSKSQIFTTAVDNQPAVTIVVAQGNRPMTKDNKQIGLFNLDGIAPAMRGVPQIEVTFDIDANGILSVSAVDKGTGKEQKITIESKGGLTDEDIERMKREAEEYAEEDKKTKERIEKKNQADSLCFSIEKAMEEMADKITDEQKTILNEKIAAVRAMIGADNMEALDNAQKDLESVWMPIVSEIYKSQTPTDDVMSQFNNMFGGGNNANDNPFASANFDPKNNPFAK